MKLKTALPLLILICILSCNTKTDDPGTEGPNSLPTIPPPQNLLYTIIAQYPKDTAAYTQGLEVYKGKLYESTGDYANSSLRITNWKTGAVEKKHMMGSDKIFGEGMTIFRDKIYQLTWVSNIVYVYDVNNITKPVQTFQWPREGWGITNNGTDLIISDGSNNLYFVNPADFTVIRTLPVVSHKGPITALNELEFINGFIYANVYEQNYIVKIDPSNGHVVGILVLENLLQQREYVPGRTDVLNGIAYDSTARTMLITGKRWPKLFEVRLN